MDLKYELFKTKKGSEYSVANTHLGDERQPNLAIAEILADMDYTVRLLHNNLRNEAIFLDNMPKDVKFPKHADAQINGVTFEFKTNQTGRLETLKSEISKAFRQAPNVLIRFEYEQNVEMAIRGEMIARKKYLASKDDKSEFEVWIMNGHKLQKYKSSSY